eukprot:s12019_g1.t1
MKGLCAVSSFVAKPPDLSHTDLGQNIPSDPTERVDKASALLDNLGRSLRTVRHSADELANAGAILAEKGDRMADVASYIKEAKAHSAKMQANIADILRLIKDMKSASEAGVTLPACLLASAMPPVNPLARDRYCSSVPSTRIVTHFQLKLLYAVLSCGRSQVVIITNSGFGWVHETAVRFMPLLLSELEDIPVISARSIFEPLGVKESFMS